MDLLQVQLRANDGHFQHPPVQAGCIGVVLTNNGECIIHLFGGVGGRVGSKQRDGTGSRIQRQPAPPKHHVGRSRDWPEQHPAAAHTYRSDFILVPFNHLTL
jgi:hypothetical protein